MMRRWRGAPQPTLSHIVHESALLLGEAGRFLFAERF
jgi:hypothetical protein